MARDSLPPGDRRSWAEAMRDVTPLRGRLSLAASAALVGPLAARSAIAADPPLADPGPGPDLATGPDLGTGPGLGIDRANAERLKRGLHPIEARLDLHGRTQAEAHRELAEFVDAAYRAGRRCVLIITGRGLGPNGPGVLKRAVPRWLAQPGLRRHVLAIAAAQPRHGGAGALYLLLRRQR
ncbi:MAG: Smr/MutS family protein [Stellaceae bacterium]